MDSAEDPGNSSSTSKQSGNSAISANSEGSSEELIPFGYYSYKCENGVVCKVIVSTVPQTDAPVYLQNRWEVGKIDEVFGGVGNHYVTIALNENVRAGSIPKKQRLFISPSHLTPLDVLYAGKPESFQNRIDTSSSDDDDDSADSDSGGGGDFTGRGFIAGSDGVIGFGDVGGAFQASRGDIEWGEGFFGGGGFGNGSGGDNF